MIYSIITSFGIVVYTLGYWPGDDAMERCEKAKQEFLQHEHKAVEEHGLKFHCAKVNKVPELETKWTNND